MSKSQDTWREMVKKAKSTWHWEWAQAMSGFQWNLYWLRKNKGWTQAELAAKIGVSQPRIARHESGGYPPSLETVAKYAHVFGVQISDLLGEPKFFPPDPVYNAAGKQIGTLTTSSSAATMTVNGAWSI